MDSYYDNLRKIKSLLIVTSLQRKEDLKAYKTIEDLKIDLDWSDISGYMIDDEVWEYVVQEKNMIRNLSFVTRKSLKKNQIQFYITDALQDYQ